MEFFRRAIIAQLGTNKETSSSELEQRQEAGSNSSSTSSASPGSRSTSAAASATDYKPSSTNSDTALSTAASATPSSNASAQTVTDFISKPEFTATKTTAYTAHGVNATDTKTGTSVYTASTYLQTANASAPGIPKNELTYCQINGTLPDNGPFCSPIHLQNLWVGFTYAVTWNPTLFSNNFSDLIVMRYADDTQGHVSNSSVVPNGQGYVNINMDKAWLDGRPGNDSTSGQNITLYLLSNPEGTQNLTKGPTISLVVDPSTLPPVLIPKLPNRLGLEIGLPIGVVAALLIILALCCGMRKHDRSWRDVRNHGKDYMAKRARRRGKGGREGGIQLEDYDSHQGPNAFSDEPYIGGSGNAFRDEIAKQREEDDRFRPIVHSY